MTTTERITDRRAFLPAALGLVLLTGCTSGDDLPPVPQVSLPYSSVWSAAPGIDVTSRGAELVRAALEAGDYSHEAGIDNSFPGYRKAVTLALVKPVTNPRIDQDIPENGAGGKLPRMTYFRQIIGLESNDSFVRATACEYTSYPDAPAGGGTLGDLHTSWSVELALVGDDPGTPSTPDTNPAADLPSRLIPTWNVFGNWKIREVNDIEPPPACADWWQERFPNYIRTPSNRLVPPVDYYKEDEYPTTPVAVQYPEWIPPSDDS